MPKTIRMADIAARMGVSTVTVSKALSGKDGVSDEIREKIKLLADEMGYHYGTSTKKGPKDTGNIGILIPYGFVEKTKSFYWDMYEHVVNRLSTNGYFGILEMVRREDELQVAKPRVLQDGKIDGIILIGQAEPPYLKMLQNSELPVMFLDFYDAASGQNCVISDGYYGMYTVTNYLISMGHREIHFIGSIHSTSSISDRYFGYCRAMMEHSIPVTEEMVVPDRGEDGVMSIHLPEKLPTAYVCNCDMVAGNVINQLKKRGICVPEDISVVGFDDFMFPGLVQQDVTTYAVDMEGMARSCVESLLRKVRNSNYIPNLKIVSGRLVIRSSVRRI
ncbi:HTH-type transcriptional repressor PurR [Caprobacter fermentans]|uniref:HTH-type transcriptional repressor PurR n=1 Tax=Caproicibacter fermentans TaxID=2576756 RepID=A0A6N8I379_9FIRM|nr:LacI family DNA-binding transcriptional regulator [Caproicibacter fermentans]MVB12398.1 HTH-type transcriptional repressor PurR [Caproicibacter fermentans]